MEHVTSDRKPPSIGELGERVRDDLHQLRDAAKSRQEELLGAVTDFIQENPLTAIGAAFGAAFVLSGGLMSKTTLRIASVGARFFFRKYLADILGNATGDLLGQVRGAGRSAGVAP